MRKTNSSPQKLCEPFCDQEPTQQSGPSTVEPVILETVEEKNQKLTPFVLPEDANVEQTLYEVDPQGQPVKDAGLVKMSTRNNCVDDSIDLAATESHGEPSASKSAKPLPNKGCRGEPPTPKIGSNPYHSVRWSQAGETRSD